LNLEDQYDRIYKYVFFHLHDRHAAEDLTQEVFLRFLGSRTYQDENRQLQYLYTIARKLCTQYFRDRMITYSLDETIENPGMEGFEPLLLQRISLIDASRFAAYRKLKSILKKIRNEIEKEERDG